MKEETDYERVGRELYELYLGRIKPDGFNNTNK